MQECMAVVVSSRSPPGIGGFDPFPLHASALLQTGFIVESFVAIPLPQAISTIAVALASKTSISLDSMPLTSQVNKTLEKYHNCCYNAQGSNTDFGGEPQCKYAHIAVFVSRHMLGEDLGPLSIKELQQLEKQLEYALSQARQRKTQMMMEQVDELRRKERQLGELNKQLKNKVSVHPSGSRRLQQLQGCPNLLGYRCCRGYHQFVAPEAAAIPRSSTTGGGESSHFMLDWAL
nr:unnamed protein product [Digitaria exilis]